MSIQWNLRAIEHYPHQQNHSSSLNRAIVAGNEQAALYIIQTNGIVWVESNGANNIVQAIMFCPTLKLVSALVNEADPTILNRMDHREHETPVQAAVNRKRPDILKLLLVKRADPNASTMSKHTPLHTACNLEPEALRMSFLKILINHGAAIDPINGFGFTPLASHIRTSRTPSSATISYLVQKGACPAQVPNAFIHSSKEESEEVVEAIKAGYVRRIAEPLLMPVLLPAIAEMVCEYV